MHTPELYPLFDLVSHDKLCHYHAPWYHHVTESNSFLDQLECHHSANDARI
jgi:hypothetical protein